MALSAVGPGHWRAFGQPAPERPLPGTPRHRAGRPAQVTRERLAYQHARDKAAELQRLVAGWARGQGGRRPSVLLSLCQPPQCERPCCLPWATLPWLAALALLAQGPEQGAWGGVRLGPSLKAPAGRGDRWLQAPRLCSSHPFLLPQPHLPPHASNSVQPSLPEGPRGLWAGEGEAPWRVAVLCTGCRQVRAPPPSPTWAEPAPPPGLSVCTQKMPSGPRLSQCPAPARAVPGAPWEQLSAPEYHCVSPGTPGGRGGWIFISSSLHLICEGSQVCCPASHSLAVRHCLCRQTPLSRGESATPEHLSAHWLSFQICLSSLGSCM